MFDDLAAYYYENVVLPFVEFRKLSGASSSGQSQDLRSALVSASSLFHLREHLPPAIRSGRTLKRSDVESLCPEYALLGDVVNASKHKTLTGGTPHGDPFITDANSLSEQILVIEYLDEEGSYRHVQKFVKIKLADGSEHNLLEVMTSVINFWERYLFSIGVLSKTRTFTHDSDVRFRRREECGDGHHDLKIIPGVRFHLSIHSFQRLNCHRKREVCAIHHASGVKYRKWITLTEGEISLLCLMKSDEERDGFVLSLPAAQIAEGRLNHLHRLEERLGRDT